MRYAARMDNLLTIQEISRRSGVAASALRFYEARGLIRSERSGAGHRRFPAMLRCAASRSSSSLSASGLSLDEIGAELAKLPEQRAPTGRDWARLSSAWTSRIDERIAELQRLKAGLTECIGCGCLVARPLPVRQSSRPRGAERTGTALLDR